MSSKSNKRHDVSKLVSISDILDIAGKYHYLQYFLVCLPAVIVSMSSVNYVFVAQDVKHRCIVPECETTNEFNVTWWPEHIDQCSRPIPNGTLEGATCTNNSFTAATELCTEWIYENNDSVVSVFNLACQPWKKNLIGVIHSVGMALAMFFAGWIADRIGRKPTLVICSVACILGNFKTLATSYSLYIFLEFLEAAVSSGAYTIGNVILIEIGTKNHRVLVGVLFAYAIYMGEAIFAVIAMFLPYWKYLLLAICSPAILFLTYIKIVYESPRWLILNGKVSQAKDTLKQMVKMNNIDINVKDLDSLDVNTLREAYDIKPQKHNEGFIEVFKCRELLKRFLVAFACKFTVSFIYYGLVVNSVGLPGNEYVNFLLGAVMSFPGELISLYAMNKFGRRLPLIFGYLISGLSCIAYGYTPESYNVLKILFYLVAKLLIAACYTGMVTYAMELFPTSVRGALLGLCTLAACAGNTVGVLTPLLAPVYFALAPISFGCGGIISSLLLTLTPETQDLPLPDTIEQIAKSVQNKKFEKDGENNFAYSDK